MHGCSKIWNFSSSVQLDIINHIKPNTRREIPHQQAAMYYFVYCVAYTSCKAIRVSHAMLSPDLFICLRESSVCGFRQNTDPRSTDPRSTDPLLTPY